MSNTLMSNTRIDRSDLFIGGRFVPAETNERITAINPATEEVVGSVPDSSPADVDRAVRAAREAFLEWRDTTAQQRSSVLTAIADGIHARAEEIKDLVQRENGAPRWWVDQDLLLAEVNYRKAAQEVLEHETERIVERGPQRTILRQEPLGVAACIVPWNSPNVLISFKASTALAAGCTVVAKPSPETSLDTYIFAEVLNDAGVPAGVYNIVTGGVGAGQALVSHPDVAKVSFTGSTAAGRQIAAECGRLLRPVTAELGGKSAAVLLDDADLDVFLASVQPLCVPYSGQACFSTTRILVPQHMHDELVDALSAKLSSFAFGDPADRATIMGPIVSERQRARVEELLASGVAEGASVVMGGGRSSGFDRGYYIDPTIFTGVTADMRIFREEIFGPALTVTPYRDEDEARALHDATTYGLSGSVFSRDLARATEFSRSLDTGQLLINGDRGVPFIPRDMYNDSALGGGVDRIGGFQQTKAITQPAPKSAA